MTLPPPSVPKPMAGPGRSERVTDDEILEVLRNATDPVLTTAEIADNIDIGQRATYDRLKQLAENGRVNTKQVGARTAVWWI